MRNNIFRLLLISLVVFALFGCQDQDTKSTAPAEQKQESTTIPIAVIDLIKIYGQSTNVKAAKEHGDAFLEKLNQEMTVLTELSKKEKNKEKAQAMYEEGVREIQQRLQDEDQLITGKITALIEEAVKETKNEVGATIIISSDLLYTYDEKADISDLIIAKIDRESISFSDKAVDEKDNEDSKAANAQEAQDKDADTDNKADKAEKDGKADKQDKAEEKTEPAGK